MPILPMLASETLIAPIQQIGNYFIMDTEKLVSNPFAEMRSVAQNDFQKKTPQIEKMTSVRNNVCDNHYRLAEEELERKKNKTMQVIHNNTSKYRFEIKLLELDRRKHDIEIKKRLQPSKNYEYDDSQIVSCSRRLGANISTPYLEKKLVYPVRVRSVTDLSVSPTVAKARQSLKEHRLQRDYHQRSMTAKSFSSGGSVLGLRSARSAPVMSSRYKNEKFEEDTTRFPVIRKQDEITSTRHNHLSMRSSTLHVKFAPERTSSARINRLERTAEILNLDPRNSNKIISGGDSTDSDDDFAEYEKIDLRAILFGKQENQHPSHDSCFSDRSLNTSIGTDASHTRAIVPIPKITPDVLQRQFENAQKKVESFLKELDNVGKHYGDGSSDEDEDGYPLERFRPQPSSTVRPTGIRTHQSEDKAESDEEDGSTSKASRAAREGNNKPPSRQKKMWEYIQGHNKDSNLSGTYSTQDLVLQRLTGVNLAKNKESCVPLNSASRAMRKTPTFKMRQVIERLKASRNRYEEHEINELKKLHELEAEGERGNSRERGDSREKINSRERGDSREKVKSRE